MTGIGSVARKLTKRLVDRAGPSGIVGSVDTPRAQQGFAAWLDVRGWALARDDRPVGVEVAVDGRVLRRVTTGMARPDVADMFPKQSRSASSGFDARIPRSELGDGREHLVEVSATVTRRGRRAARRLASVVVIREDASVVPHSRGSSKEVWNHEARSDYQAKHAVCGSHDREEYERSGESTALDVATNTEMNEDDVVLEIGCGTGRVGAKLAPRCRTWVGSDISSGMLTRARDALQHLSNTQFVELSGVGLEPFADQSFDIVYCTAVFMHLDEWDRFGYVREAYRVLRPGGRAYFDNLNLLGDRGWAVFEGIANEHDSASRPPNVSKASTPDELRTYAERAGFTDIRVRSETLFVTVFARKP